MSSSFSSRNPSAFCAGKERFAVLPEFQSQYGFDVIGLAQLYEFECTGRVVDVRERQGAGAQDFGIVHELFGGEGAVAQAEVGVAVEEQMTSLTDDISKRCHLC